MPYELFWHGKLSAFDNYMYANAIKQREREISRDIDAFTVGHYTQKAMMSAYKLFNPFASKKDKNFDYPKRPEIATALQLSKDDKEKQKNMKEAILKHNAEIDALLQGKKGG